MTTSPTLAVLDPAAALVLAAVVAAIGAGALLLRATRRAGAAASALADARTRDVLTGLRTREAAEEVIDGLLAQRRPFAVLLVELDRFGTINESYGHEVGDRLLRVMSEHLEGNVRPDELLARWGGPRMAVISPGLASSDEALRRASQLADPLSATVHVGHDTLPVSASVGVVAVADGAFDSTAAVAGAADTALEVARAEGRAGRRSYDGTLRRPVGASPTGPSIERALADDQLLVLYEPIVMLDDRSIAGLQAVPHWADPERGILPLSEWEDVLEASGLEAEVARRLLERVVTDAAPWTAAHPELELVVVAWTPPTLLADPDTPYRVERLVADAGLAPASLCASVVGRARSDLLRTWGPLRELQDLGLQVALSRFGVGWATLSYLRQLQLDVLKLPPELLVNLGRVRNDEAVVQQVLGLANALDVIPIAEGITRKDQAELLLSLGCPLGQGPWISRPLPVDAVEPILARGKVVADAARAGIDWRAPTG